MEENKRMIMLFAVIFIIVGLILIISFWPEKDKTFACNVKKEGDYSNLAAITYDDYKCLKDEEEAVIAVGDFDKKEKTNLNAAGYEASIGIYYISDEISKDDLKTIKKQLSYSDKSFEKNVILVVKKGKVVEYKEDVFDSSENIYSFFEEAGLAKYSCGIKASEEYENLAVIDYDDYECLYNSDKAFTLVVAQTTCSYCQQYEPIINDYAMENNIPIYVINIDQLSEGEVNDLLASLSYFDDNDWGTPLTLGIKDKEVIANISGYTDDISAIDSFMEETGLK